MKEILDTTNSLEIKEISNDLECGNLNTTKCNDNYVNFQVDNENGDKQTSSIISKSYNLEEIVQLETKIVDYRKELYKCNKCDKSFKEIKNLNQHKASAHEGIKFPCNKCNQTFTRRDSLNTHIKNVHGQLNPTSRTLSNASRAVGGGVQCPPL